MRFTVLLLACLVTVVLAQQLVPIKVSKLAVVPETLVFFSGLPQDKGVLLYNYGNAPAKWSLGPYSAFLKINTSDVPNPLPPLSGAYLRVSVVWDLVPTDAGTIEKPGTLIALLEKILGIDIPDRYKHFGVGLFSIRDETTPGFHIVTVFTVMH